MIGNKKNQGFTLLEIVVVLAIFSVLMLIAADVFMMALSSQRQTALRQETFSQMRYLTEMIARQIRASEIDFTPVDPDDESNPLNNYALDGDSGIDGYETQLSLIDQEGSRISYFVQTGKLKMSLNYAAPVDLTDAQKFKVVKLWFYIDPPTSPFSDERCSAFLEPNGCRPTIECSVDSGIFPSGFCVCSNNGDCATKNCAYQSDLDDYACRPFNRQPRVTMVLVFESASVKELEQKRIHMQTTVSSRVYKR